MARLQPIIVGAAVILAAACSQPYLGVKIPVVATWGGKPMQCSDPGTALSDLRFYLSAIELIDADGAARKLRLHADIPWQQSNLALLDLEDGLGACANGSRDTYGYLVGGVPPGEYRGLRFTVGVPFENNHANPLSADAPLDDPAMHWHWRSGYKFIRAGVKTDDDGFWIHVGSAGCEGTVGNISGCRFPNRVAVELPEFTPNRDSVAVDLEALFSGIDLQDGKSSNCSSGPAEVDCEEPFAALGIDFRSGALTGTQRVFSIQR